jgi:hypothetical protein
LLRFRVAIYFTIATGLCNTFRLGDSEFLIWCEFTRFRNTVLLCHRLWTEKIWILVLLESRNASCLLSQNGGLVNHSHSAKSRSLALSITGPGFRCTWWLQVDIWLPIMEEEQPSSETPSQPPLTSSAPGAPNDQKPLKKRFEEHWLIFLLCFAAAVFLAGFGVKELLDARIRLEVTNTLKDMAKTGGAEG